ncbi:MAG: RidA family protein [Rhodospirillales bacterium]
MNRLHNPAGVHAPLSNYAHGVEVPAGARWLHVSGQIGMAPDGKVGKSFEEQAEIAWRNLLAVLESAGMGPGDLVKVTTYLTRREDIKANRAARDKHMAGVRAASTMVLIGGLAMPELLIEVEAHAAKA